MNTTNFKQNDKHLKPDDRVLMNAFGHSASKAEFDAITQANHAFLNLKTHN